MYGKVWVDGEGDLGLGMLLEMEERENSTSNSSWKKGWPFYRPPQILVVVVTYCRNFRPRGLEYPAATGTSGHQGRNFRPSWERGKHPAKSPQKPPKRHQQVKPRAQEMRRSFPRNFRSSGPDIPVSSTGTSGRGNQSSGRGDSVLQPGYSGC